MYLVPSVREPDRLGNTVYCSCVPNIIGSLNHRWLHSKSAATKDALCTIHEGANDIANCLEIPNLAAWVVAKLYKSLNTTEILKLSAESSRQRPNGPVPGNVM